MTETWTAEVINEDWSATVTEEVWTLESDPSITYVTQVVSTEVSGGGSGSGDQTRNQTIVTSTYTALNTDGLILAAGSGDYDLHLPTDAYEDQELEFWGLASDSCQVLAATDIPLFDVAGSVITYNPQLPNGAMLRFKFFRNSDDEPGWRLTWDSTDSGAAGSSPMTFVFNSSGGQTGNRYNDWDALQAALATAPEGAKVVWLEQNETLPAAEVDLSNAGLWAMQPDASVGGIMVTCPNGCTIVNPAREFARNILFVSESAAPIVTIGASHEVILDQNTIVVGSEDAAFFTCAGDVTGSGISIMTLKNSSLYRRSDLQGFGLSDGPGAVSVPSGKAFVVTAVFGSCEIKPDTITGAGMGIVSVAASAVTVADPQPVTTFVLNDFNTIVELPSSTTVGKAVEFGSTDGKTLREANLTGPGGRPVLDEDGTWPDSLHPASIARNTEVTTAISNHAGATDPHGDRAYALALVEALDTVFQGASDELSALGALASAANKLPYFTGEGSASLTDLSAFARTLLDDADAAAARSTLGIAIGSTVQAYSALLAALAAQTWAADQITYQTGANTVGTTALSSFMRGRLAETAGWVPVSNTVVANGGSGVASISVSCSGYRHLRVRFKGRSTRTGATTDTLSLTFNSDSTSKYGRGAGALQTAYSLSSGWTSSNTNTDRMGSTSIDIDCGNSSWTQFRASTNAVASTATTGTSIDAQSGVYTGTGAITSIQLAFANGNIADGASLILEGWA